MIRHELLQFLDPFPEPMLLVTPDGAIIGANRPTADKLGVPREQLRNRLLQDFAESPEEVAHYLRGAARTRALVPGTFVAGGPGEEKIALRIEAALAVPGSGDTPGILVVRLLPKEVAVGQFIALNQRIHDLSHEMQRRSAAETALRESEERLRFMAEAMPQKIYTASATGEFDYLNFRWSEFTGLRLEQIRGWGWMQIVHADELAENARRWREAIARRTPFEFEHRFRRHDGAYRWHLTRAHPMQNEGAVVLWVGSSTDIHDRKEAEGALRQAWETAERNRQIAEEASQAKDDFLAALSHELRTPLTPVLLTACDLAADSALPAETREQLRMMCRNIELEARLIDDLLDLARISHGKLQIRRSVVDVHELILHSEKIMRSAVALAGTDLRVILEATEHHTIGDPVRLQQVFWNLLKNALKFSLGAGTVTVRSSNPSPNCLAIAFTDTGIGIAPDVLERIFRPFEQAPRSERHQFGGLGLGLAISKAIMELHGGKLEAASGGRGKGATFTVELDTVASAELPPGPPPARLSANAGTLRLLLVEDHVETCAVLARLLQRAGHQVTTAASVTEALAKAAEREFDGVISDLGLPDGTGLELMRQLKSTYGLPGIALSGFGMETDLEASAQAGFSAHLVKPVELDRLMRALETILTPR